MARPYSSAGVSSGLSGLLLGGGPTDDDARPGTDEDAAILGQLSTLTRGQRVAGQCRARSPDIGAVGALQILDPPALSIGGQLGMAPAHADVRGALDLGMDVAAPRGPSDQQAVGLQGYDHWQSRGRARLVAMLLGVPVRVDPDLGHPLDLGGRCYRWCPGVWNRRLRRGHAQVQGVRRT